MNKLMAPALPGTLRPITLEDRPLFELAFSRLREPVTDASFAACFVWAEAMRFSWALIDEHLCVFSADDDELCLILPPMALTPTASDRLGNCVDSCFDLMDDFNEPRAGRERSRIEYVSDEMLERLRTPGVMQLSAEPMYFDYVYPAAAMVELTGGDLKGKRKLRNAFVRECPNATTADLRPEDLDECLALLDRWKRRGDETHEGEANDQLVGSDVLRRHDEMCTERALRFHRELGLEAMTLRVDGRLVGFTLGERLTETMASVLVEKVDLSVRGAAQFIFSEFCRTRFADCTEINAGDDWGIPTLRHTKSSYRPSRLLAKSVLTRQPQLVVAGGEPLTVRAVASPDRPHTATEGVEEAMIDIRPARREDAPAICRIEEEAFVDADERFTLRQAQRLIDNPRAMVIVAESEGETIGWAVTLTRRTRSGRSGRLYAIAVRPDRAGRGVGRRLAEEAVHALDAMGVERIYLEARENNAAAIALYRSLGFDIIARLPRYYGERRPGVRMRRTGPIAAKRE